MLSAAVPQFVSLLLMRTIFSQNGIVNTLLINNGIIDNAIPFWSNATLARVMVIVINIWIGIPFTVMQVTGILQSIPEEIYEAARVDGAGPVKIFFKITLPLLSPTVFFVLVTRVIGALQVFDLVYMVMDISNPALKKTESIVYLFYQYSFQNGNKGYGSAIVVLLLAVIMVLTVFQMIGQKKWVHYN